MQEANPDSSQDLYNSNQQPFQSSQQPQQKPSNEAQQIEAQKQQYEIIQDEADNQVILVKIKRGHMLWYKGKMLFSSLYVSDKFNDFNFVKAVMDGFGIFATPKGLVNMTKEMGYFVFSREAPYNGKILTLSEETYKEKFYINLDHLLTINYDSHQYTLSSHPEIKTLKLIYLKSPSDPLFVSVQSTRDTAIIEKCLGVGEYMYLPNARILAMSQKIGYKWESKTRMARFEGPGFIFFEPESKIKNMSMRNRELILANFLLLSLVLVLYFIEWYYLN